MRLRWINETNPQEVFRQGELVFNQATNGFLRGDGMTAGGVSTTVQPPTISYTHNQSVAATVWTITHNLGFYPGVTTVDSAGTTIIGDVHHTDKYKTTVTFTSATGGQGFLS